MSVDNVKKSYDVVEVSQGTESKGEFLLEVDGLSTTFLTPLGRVRAVENVTLRLRPEESLGIVGESGSGKSVVVRSMMGLVSPGDKVEREGSIVFAGEDLATMSRKDVRLLWGREIAMV